MRTVEVLLRALDTTSAANIRIITGQYSRSRDARVADESARRTHGDLAATTDADGVKPGARRGITMSVSLEEALALVEAGATTKLSLQ